MNVGSLESHLMILLNAPDNIEDFNWDKVFDHWKKNKYDELIKIKQFIY